MEPAEHLPPWLREKQQVGHLAELFTWNHERLLAVDPSRVRWVSQDASLGYDIEDLNASPSRRIEVKGSRGSDVSFIMSPNEISKARRYDDSYELHFWGQLNLAVRSRRALSDEVAAGYTLIVVDPVAEFDLGGWTMEPDGWWIAQV